MKRKNIASYQLIEEVVDNAANLFIGSNEAIYIHSFFSFGRQDFAVSMESATNKVNYTNQNCTVNFQAEMFTFQSNLVNSHFSTINISNPNKVGFFIQYVRVIFNPNN